MAGYVSQAAIVNQVHEYIANGQYPAALVEAQRLTDPVAKEMGYGALRVAVGIQKLKSIGGMIHQGYRFGQETDAATSLQGVFTALGKHLSAVAQTAVDQDNLDKILAQCDKQLRPVSTSIQKA